MPATKTAPKEMSLAELRRFDGQLFIRNNTPHKQTFCQNFGKDSVDFQLEPSGEPDSITFLPRLALEIPGLQRLWMKKAVTISTDSSTEDEITLLQARAVGIGEERATELMSHTTAVSNSNDMVEKICLSCGFRNKDGVVERGRVLQSPRQVKDGQAPLCSEHTHLSHQFVPRLVSEKGEQRWEFDSLKVDAVRPSR